MRPNRNLKAFLGLLLTLPIGALRAANEANQAPAPEGVLRLQPLLEEALRNRPELQAARYDALAQKASVGPAGTYDNPKVGFKGMDVAPGSLRPTDMSANEISLSQMVPFPGKLTHQKKAARFEYGSKAEAFTVKQLELVRDVKTAYYDLFLAHKKRDILNDQMALLHQVLGVARSRYALSKMPQAELLGLQVQEGNFRDQILVADKEITVKAGDLNYLVGRSSYEPLPRPEDLQKTPFDMSKISEEELNHRAFQSNPSLKAVLFDLEAANQRLAYAKEGWLPDFEFMVSRTNRPALVGEDSRTVSGGVEVSIPLWGAWKQSGEVKAAEAGKSGAASDLEEEKNHLSHEVHVMYSEFVESSQRLELYEGGLLPLVRQAEL